MNNFKEMPQLSQIYLNRELFVYQAKGKNKEMASQDFSISLFTYNDNDNTATLEQYVNPQPHPPEFIFPSSIQKDGKTYEITKIAEKAFENAQISTIKFDENSKIKRIGRKAFSKSSLRKIILPITSKSIEGFVEGASQLETVSFSSQPQHNLSITQITKSKKGQPQGYYLSSFEALSQDSNEFQIILFVSRSIRRFNFTKPVMRIANGAFSRCQLTTISFPSSVSRIESNAFSYCSELQTIVFPSDITFIGKKAFKCCSKLQSVKFPPKLTIISKRAFESCSRLKEAEFSNNNFGQLSIEEYAFANCLSLEKVTLPVNLIVLQKSVFFNTKVHTLTLPQRMNEIEGFAAGTGSLTSIYLSPMESDDSMKMSLNIISQNEVQLATERNNLIFVTRNCTNLTIPENIVRLTYGCCSSCSLLTSVYFLTTELTEIGSFAFFECRALTSITIPKSVTEIGESAFNSCWALTLVIFENGSQLVTIGSFAFNNCHQLAKVDFPQSLTSIGDYAFFDTKVKPNNLPAGIHIGHSAFPQPQN